MGDETTIAGKEMNDEITINKKLLLAKLQRTYRDCEDKDKTFMDIMDRLDDLIEWIEEQ